MWSVWFEIFQLYQANITETIAERSESPLREVFYMRYSIIGKHKVSNS